MADVPLMSNPMTTQDDLVVGGASGAPTRLAKGTDGQRLTVDPATHHLAWADPVEVADILDLPTAETDTALVLAPDGAGGVEFRAETGGGGGSTALAPKVKRIYSQDAQNTATWSKSVGALATTDRIIVLINSFGRDVNTPTLSNVTFTQVQAVNFATTSYYSAYVGVPSSTSGTTLGITATGANWIVADIYVVTDALTPTAGTAGTLTDTDAAAQQGVALSIATTQGDFVICGFAQEDGGTTFTNLFDNFASVQNTRGANASFISAIGRALGPTAAAAYFGGGSGKDLSAGIIVVS